MATRDIKQICIPVRKADLTEATIKSYLPYVIEKFNEIKAKLRKDYDFYLLNHPVLLKERIHDDSDINNKCIIPDIFAMVDWKIGYVFGNPIKYAQTKTLDTDDIEYLNKYLRGSCKASVDKDVATWVYSAGVGYYFIEPKSEDFDVGVDAPFEVYCREADTCFKVYSAYGSKPELFDVLYTQVEDQVLGGLVKDVYDVYTHEAMYTYEGGTSGIEPVLTNTQPRSLYTMLPLVEKRANKNGVGIVGLGSALQEALDNIASNGLDSIEEVVNDVYVYENVDLGETPDEMAENHQKMKKNGAIVLTTNEGDKPAKVHTIHPDNKLADFTEMYTLLNSVFHSVVGVPLEVSNTNSGDTTKSGSEVANGYDNAYNRALSDINTFLEADTKLLNRIMKICELTPNSHINNVKPTDIEIKYSLNLTDNMLIKSQSFGTFIQYMPPAMALRMCRLSNDAESEGKLIEEYMAKKAEEDAKKSESNG